MISARLIKIIASCVASIGILGGTYFFGTSNKNLDTVPQETINNNVVEKENEEITSDKNDNDIQDKISNILNSDNNQGTTQGNNVAENDYIAENNKVTDNDNVSQKENTDNSNVKNNENSQVSESSNGGQADLDKNKLTNNKVNLQENTNVSIEDIIKKFNNSTSNSNGSTVASDNTQSVEENKNILSKEASDSSSYIAEIEQLIFQKVNEERTASGLSPLSYNNTMEHYARLKSKDMGDGGYFDHANPEGQYITSQMKADGVSYRAWGENIAYISGASGNSVLADRFMTNWMNSSGHRANILSTNFTSIGVGVYKTGNTYYATQEFYK